MCDWLGCLKTFCGRRIVVAWNGSDRNGQCPNPAWRKVTTMKARLYVTTAFTALGFAAYTLSPPSAALAADGVSLLAGKVVSTAGEALAGIPAHRKAGRCLGGQDCTNRFHAKIKATRLRRRDRFRNHRRSPRHRSTEGIVLSVQQLPHAAVGTGRAAHQGGLGPGRQEDGGPAR